MPENKDQHKDGEDEAEAEKGFFGLSGHDPGFGREEIAVPHIVNSLARPVPLAVPKDAKVGRDHRTKEGAEGKARGNMEEELPEVG